MLAMCSLSGDAILEAETPNSPIHPFEVILMHHWFVKTRLFDRLVFHGLDLSEIELESLVSFCCDCLSLE